MSLFYGQSIQPSIIYSDSIAIPRGVTQMFHGSSTIPTRWTKCNGQKGTPDLRDEFIVAAGDYSTVGSTAGGSTLTLTADNLPQHYHPTVMLHGVKAKYYA